MFRGSLTADFHRLQHLSWDAKIGVDDKTGWALLDKLLAEPNRVFVEPWSLQDRKAFPNRIPDSQAGPTLWDLIKMCRGWNEEFTVLIEQLLPERPRGLANLYQYLLQSMPSADSNRTPPLALDEFIETLASCRQEPLLAKRLRQVREQQGDWAREVRLSKEDLTPENWWDLACAARQRQSGSCPEPSLIPLMGLQTSHEQLEAWVRGGSADSHVSNTMVVIRNSSDAHDPLRHNWLHELPLRDASETDRPFWCELLVDRTLTPWRPVSETDQATTAPLDTALGRRAYVLTRWRPLAARCETAQLKLLLPKATVRRFFERLEDLDAGQALWSALRWIRYLRATGDLVTLEIGWLPLIANLRTGEDRSVLRLMTALNLAIINRLDPVASSPAQLDLLPGRLWSLVLLVDALDHCPWQELSAPRLWSIAAYLGLAAGLVKAAYAYALDYRVRTAKPGETCRLHQWLRCLDDRDAAYWLGMSEDDLLKDLDGLLGEESDTWLTNQPGPLGNAACAYVKSDLYRQTRRLLHDLY